ncbi:MAG: Crp/Fnr family transcriptional regulator [Chloroflexi bacterium]|nr:Crp/Fnr family transcriptional regulator [Chloroflexota bacterium]
MIRGIGIDGWSRLGEIPSLRHLSGRALRAMTERACVCGLCDGDILVHQGDILRSIYFVESGGIRLISYSADGQAVALKIYGPGDVFGLLATSDPYPHPAQIEAIHDTVVIGIEGQEVRRLIAQFPEIALTIIDLFAAHVHEGHERVQHMATKRVDRRLAQCLLKFADKFGIQQDHCLELDVPLSQRDLAEFANTTVETINRTLAAWEKQGILTCSHKHIDILDQPALESIAEAETYDPIIPQRS